MPNQKLTGGSSLLTLSGWRKLNSVRGVHGVIGVDRSGKLSEMPVELSLLGKSGTVAFVGSEKTFGQFHPSTRLMDSDGVSHLVSAIVEENRIAECLFENAVHCDGIVVGPSALDGLWSEIESAAIIFSDSYLVLQARGKSISGARSALLYEKEGSGSEATAPRYVRVEKKEFKTVPSDEVPGLIFGLINILFEELADGVKAYDRPDHFWCLWSLLLSEAGACRSGALSYDSLQHTTRIYLGSGEERAGSGLSRGRTAFYKNHLDDEYEVAWTDASWNPISSGFILSSG